MIKAADGSTPMEFDKGKAGLGVANGAMGNGPP